MRTKHVISAPLRNRAGAPEIITPRIRADLPIAQARAAQSALRIRGLQWRRHIRLPFRHPVRLSRRPSQLSPGQRAQAFRECVDGGKDLLDVAVGGWFRNRVWAGIAIRDAPQSQPTDRLQ